MTEITKDGELETLLKENKRCIVDYFTTWCGPCRMLTPELAKVEERHPEWTIIRVDAEKFPDLFAKTKSQGVPTICFVVENKQKEVVVGYRPSTDIEELIKKY